MASVERTYEGTCGGCDLRITWTLVGDDDSLRLIAPATIILAHLCQHPPREVQLSYEGEATPSI